MSITVNLNSQADCQRAWYNYTQCGNSMGVTSEDMQAIQERWGSSISHWVEQFDKDNNSYEGLDDIDYNAAKKNGEAMAKESAGGYDGNVSTGRIVFDSSLAATSIASAGSAVVLGGNYAIAKTSEVAAKKTAEEAAKRAATASAQKAAEEAGGKVASEATRKAAEEATTASAEATAKAGEATAKKAAASKAANVGAYIQAGISAAVATKYLFEKPNKEEHEAAMQLQAEMLPESQAALAEAQDEMQEIEDDVIEKQEEIQEKNDENSGKIEEEKTQYDLYGAAVKEIKAKAASGEQLTDEEKSLYKASISDMQETSDNITGIQEDNTDMRDDISAEIEDRIDDYSVTEETMAEVEGVTEYAEGFDDTSRLMSNVEGVSQAANAVSGGWAAAKLLAMSGGLNWANIAMAAVGAYGATVSTGASKEQFTYASDIGNEIHLRRDVQDFNAESSELLEQHVEVTDVAMQDVEEIELMIPDEIEPPKDDLNLSNTENEQAANNIFQPNQTQVNTNTSTSNTSYGNNVTNNINAKKKEQE